MATYSITEVMARLRGLPEQMANTAVEIMRDEIKISTHGTGELAKSVKAEKTAESTYTISTNKWVGGGIYGIREVGAIIREGRKPLDPRYKAALAFDPPPGWQGPISKKTGQAILAHAGPARPNDFVARTKNRLEHLQWTLEGGK